MKRGNVDADAFADSRVLVTGGQGFIGSNLVLRLAAARADVTVVDCLAPGSGANPFNLVGIEGRVSIVNADLRDADRMRTLLAGRDYVFHLAAQISHTASMSDPLTDLDVNVRGTLTLLEVSRQVSPQVKIIFTSTRQVYGAPQYLPVDERHPLAPPDVNGVSKLAAEGYLGVYQRVYGIDASILRLTNTYGPRMRVCDPRQTFVGFWVRLLVENRPIEIYGDGAQRRDLNHVDDVVDALLLATRESAAGRVFNLGDERPVSLHDLAERMVAMRPGSTYRFVEFPTERKLIDIGDYCGDFSAFAQVTGWKPHVSLEQGLRDTVDFFAQHRSQYW